MTALFFRLAAASLAFAATAGAFAQANYPNRPIRVIVPYPAGGTTDVLARTVDEKLTEAWGQMIIVDNCSGAGGLIGTDLAAKAVPDGYTLILGNNQTHSANAALFEKVPFDLLRDFQPVAMVATSRHVIVVPANSPAKTIRELVTAVGAEPGGGPPELLGQTVAAEVAKWTRLVRDRNLRFDP